MRKDFVAVTWILIHFILLSYGFSPDDLKRISESLRKQNNEFQLKANIFATGNNIDIYYDQYKKNVYKDQVENANILAVPIDIEFNENFGQALGNYFDAYCKSKEIGAHFLGVWRNENQSLVNSQIVIPTFVYQQHLLFKEESVQQFNNLSSGKSWKDKLPSEDWPNCIGDVRDMLRKLVLPHLQRLYPSLKYFVSDKIAEVKMSLASFQETNILLSPLKVSRLHPSQEHKSKAKTSGGLQSKHDILPFLLNHENRQHYLTRNNTSLAIDHPPIPLIPDAALPVRCNELLKFGFRNGLGFLNFNIYTQIIPSTSKSIYILTESSSADNEIRMKCDDIIQSLLLFLDLYYPNATIAVMRGDELSQLAMIMESPLVICTPSTFCFWAGWTSNFPLYFPATNLMNGGKLYLYQHKWRWITFPKLHVYHPDLDKESKGIHKLLHSMIHYPEIPSL